MSAPITLMSIFESACSGGRDDL